MRPKILSTDAGLPELDTMSADLASAETVRPAGPQVDASGADLAAEECFDDRYEVGDLVGVGGMGEVRVVRDRRIGRDVALKALRAEEERRDSAGEDEVVGSGTSPRSRFEREARIQGQLEHPNVVPVYDLGVRTDGTPYFTMKRVQGLTLEQVVQGLREGDAAVVERFTLRRLLSDFSQLCLTMAYAHSRGVVHRDLKPANIILGDFGEVYVLDWGVAKVPGVIEQGRMSRPELLFGEVAASPLEIEAVDETTAGTMLGTPGFMAPEQVGGDLDAIDGRADIFALGAILYELLALEPMVPRASLAGMLGTTMTGGWKRPSERAPDREVPPEIEAIWQRATAIDPADRFPDARRMHQAIERYLDGDRDRERRHQMAAAHVDRAKEALAAAKREPSAIAEHRERAIHELNAALVIEPGQPEALEAMVRAYVDATEHLPPEAEAELEQSRRRTRSRTGKAVAIGFLSAFLAEPLLAWMGVRAWGPIVKLGVILVIAAALSYWFSRVHRITSAHVALMMVIVGGVAASTAVLFGPFILVPTIVVACAIPLALNVRANSAQRMIVMTIGVLAITLPILFQWLGLLPSSYQFENGEITIVPWAVEFPPVAAQAFLLAISILVFVVSMKVIGKTVDALVAAERKLFAQAWSLRNLIPAEARGAADSHLDHEPEESCSRCPPS